MSAAWAWYDHATGSNRATAMPLSVLIDVRHWLLTSFDSLETVRHAFTLWLQHNKRLLGQMGLVADASP